MIISAGKTAIWDSTVCKTALGSDDGQAVARLVHRRPSRVERSRLGPGVFQEGGVGDAGRYTVEIGTLGGEPGKTKFTLTPAPKPREREEEVRGKKPDDEKPDQNSNDD